MTKDTLSNIFNTLYVDSMNPQDIIKKEDQKARKQKLENDHSEAELELKKSICSWVKLVVSMYLVFIAFIIAIITCIKGLSDSVLIALLTTTTINILGLPLMIILSLFPNSKGQKVKDSKISN